MSKRQSGDAPHGCPRCAAAPGQDHLPACPDRPARDSLATGRDWRDMTPEDFGHDAGPAVLFDLEPAQVPADDGHGTGDLLALT